MRRTFPAMLLVLGWVGAVASPSGTYVVYCELLAGAGEARLDADTGLVRPGGVGLDVAMATPGWILASVQGEQSDEQVSRAVVAVARAVGVSGTGAGLLPWTAGGAPSLAATELAAPPLCAVLVSHSDALKGAARQTLLDAVKQMATALARSKPEGRDSRRLTFAAACCALGKAAGRQELTNRGLELVEDWVTEVRARGLADGHGPTTEAYRAAALAWIRFFVADRPGGLMAAWQLTWADLLQRLVRPLGPLAGVEVFSTRPDYADGTGPLRWMLAVAGDRGLPEVPGEGVLPLAMTASYFCLPFVTPAVAGEVAPPRPATMTYTWQPVPKLAQETTWVGEGVALSTMTGPVEAATIPVVVSYAGLDRRPTSYAFVSSPGRVVSVQQEGTAAVNFEFDGVGVGARVQVWADFVVGRREAIKRVAIMGYPWNGQTVAVDELQPLAVEMGDAYLGVLLGWCGPADASQLTERVKPGILSWSEDGPDAELTLRVFARQAQYLLRAPEDNYVLGMFVAVRPVSSCSFEDFTRWLRGVRYKKEFQVRKWRVPEKDKGHPVLDRYKPKEKRALAIARADDYTVTWIVQGKPWVIKADLRSGDVLERSIDGGPLADTKLVFDTPWVRVARGGRSFVIAPELSAVLLGK
ncbi:MAG: hypothetical protein N2512_09975 [Armatimonadetes bacterium]|nr:hypothetical protein [Armatimonadota bacterium]